MCYVLNFRTKLSVSTFCQTSLFLMLLGGLGGALCAQGQAECHRRCAPGSEGAAANTGDGDLLGPRVPAVPAGGGVKVFFSDKAYLKSSFPKRNKCQIKKKRARAAILLCTEPIHCSVNVSCQSEIFPCLNGLQCAVLFQTATSAKHAFRQNAISPLNQ